MSCAGLQRGSAEYERLKEERSAVLWAGVEQVIPDIRRRAHISMVRARARQLCDLLSGLKHCTHGG